MVESEKKIHEAELILSSEYESTIPVLEKEERERLISEAQMLFSSFSDEVNISMCNGNHCIVPRIGEDGDIMLFTEKGQNELLNQEESSGSHIASSENTQIHENNQENDVLLRFVTEENAEKNSELREQVKREVKNVLCIYYLLNRRPEYIDNEEGKREELDQYLENLSRKELKACAENALFIDKNYLNSIQLKED